MSLNQSLIVVIYLSLQKDIQMGNSFSRKEALLYFINLQLLLSYILCKLIKIKFIDYQVHTIKVGYHNTFLPENMPSSEVCLTTCIFVSIKTVNKANQIYFL